MDISKYKELLKNIKEIESLLQSVTEKRKSLSPSLINSRQSLTELEKRKKETLRLMARDEASEGHLAEVKALIDKAENEERDLQDLIAAIDHEIKALQTNKTQLQNMSQECKRVLWIDISGKLKQRLYEDIGNDLSKAYVASTESGRRLTWEMFLQDLFEGHCGKYGPTPEQCRSLETELEKKYFA